MAVIQVLSRHVADLIAAGEVVERPASVVKELVENSFDAGAKNVTLELRGGGAQYIRVTDDGCGMAQDDAATAFLRHATSKLRDARGLEAIGSMGFRGEALAAISAVSRVELLTRREGDGTGTLVMLEAGEVTDMREVGCPKGSSMTVRDLFFNTPARQKFMRSDRAEGQACVSAALRSAMGRPDISLRCIRDGREEFFTPGDGRLKSCLYSLLGRELAMSLLPCLSEADGVTVRGFVSAPGGCRGNRAAQFFFVNGRPIRSLTMQAALEQAYRNRVMTGRFPCCVLYVELGAASVDVNVHPTKAEVRFSDEKKVFDGVYYAAMSALDAPDEPVEPETRQRAELFAAVEPSKPKTEGGDRAVLRTPEIRYQAREKTVTAASDYIHRGSPAPANQGRGALNAKPGDAAAALYAKGREAVAAPPQKSAEKPREQLSLPLGDAPLRVIGEAMDTYIIAQEGDRLLLIDKHAAHERIIFDRLRQAPEEIMSQTLLMPETVRVGGDMELVEQNGELLLELGFELEPYGEDAVIIRALPDGIDPGEAAAALEELIEKLRRNKSAEPESARDAVLKTVACKAAIKAGRSSDISELTRLAKRVVSGEVRYCPHGRPVCVTLTKRELDKLFKRIV